MYLLEEDLELSANKTFLHLNINIKLWKCRNTCNTKMSMEFVCFGFFFFYII